MPNKPFLTIQQQIDLLKERGLKIDNEQDAADFLYRNNYYRISGYSLTLRKNDVFIKGATFQSIKDIYNLDCEIRFILLRSLLKIETTIKSVYSYEFGKVFSPTQYKDASIFTNEKYHNEIITAAKKLMANQKDSEPYLKHHSDKNLSLPIWAFMGILTFGTISKLYYISNKELKNATSKALGYKNSQVLANHLHCLSIMRNICAHNSRIYGRSFRVKPRLSKKEFNILPYKGHKKDNSKLISIIFCFKKLLKKSEFISMLNELNEAIKQYPDVDISYYGMKENWKEVILKLIN